MSGIIPKHDRTISKTSWDNTYFLEDGIIGEHAVINLGTESENVVFLSREDIVALLAKMDGDKNA